MNSGFMIARDPRTERLSGDVAEGKEGRAIRMDGSPYAVTSQAVTDALNPFTVGGLCIAAQGGQPAEVASCGYSVGNVVEVIAAGAILAGERVRPAYNADAALNDRFAGLDATALPGGAGTYYTWGRALAAAGTGDRVKIVLFPEETIVVGG